MKKRIDKDKARKQLNQEQRRMQYDNFDNVITYQNYIAALKKCNLNVGFKLSVQQFNFQALTNIHQIIETIRNGTIPELKNVRKIILTERGKKRVITPITINDRVTQRVLCDNALVPMILPKLIYDNGASIDGKGVQFTRKRLNKHLEDAKREYGSEFYCLTFDFKNYFGSIPHKVCYDNLNKLFIDKKLCDLMIGIIELYQIQENKGDDEIIAKIKNHEGVGICLGSQISQVLALIVLNDFDHYIKDNLGMKYYIRYMDDGVIFHNNKDFLQSIIGKLEDVAAKVGLNFNKSKTAVIKMSKGFTFLKVKYRIKSNCRTIKILEHSGIVRIRRKMKKLKYKLDSGIISLNDCFTSFQSWLNNSRKASSFHTRKSMLSLYDNLFGGYKITHKYYSKHTNETWSHKYKTMIK